MDFLDGFKDVILENKTICIIFILICLLYYHFTSTFTFFKKHGIPFKEPTIFFGNIKARVLTETSFHEFNLQLYRDFEGEPYAGYFEGRRPILIIRDPDLIKTILIRDFDHFVDRVRLTPNEPNYLNKFVMNLKGQEWRVVRSMLTPCFSSARIRAMVPYINQCATNVIKQMETDIKDNPEIEIKKYMNYFTLDTISSCAFGIDCEETDGNESYFIKVASRFTDMPVLKHFYVLIVLLLMSEAAKYLTVSFWNLKAVNELRKMLISVKEERRKNSANRRNDFLQLFLDSSEKEKEAIAKNPAQKRYLDEDTIDAQSLQFVLAGFETSSAVMAFAFHLLALNPDVQTKLREEVKEVTARYKGEINYDSISDMTYLDGVLFETMRIFPPLSIIDRECVKKYTLPGSNVTLMPGQRLIIPVLGLHHDSQYYPEPDKFKPERFVSEEKGTRPAHLYLPFGAGPRNCIGMRFAIVEIKLTIAKMIMKFEVTRCSKTQVPVKLNRGGVLLKSDTGIWVKLSPVSS